MLDRQGLCSRWNVARVQLPGGSESFHDTQRLRTFSICRGSKTVFPANRQLTAVLLKTSLIRQKAPRGALFSALAMNDHVLLLDFAKQQIPSQASWLTTACRWILCLMLTRVGNSTTRLGIRKHQSRNPYSYQTRFLTEPPQNRFS